MKTCLKRYWQRAVNNDKDSPTVPVSIQRKIKKPALKKSLVPRIKK
jgi:hypothetical protein